MKVVLPMMMHHNSHKTNLSIICPVLFFFCPSANVNICIDADKCKFIYNNHVTFLTQNEKNKTDFIFVELKNKNPKK